ncbi:MAG: glycosyltransferase, partial [Nanoarchaeota archaeon]|nr:glycosyltransferase [Nanoarchaeota archaeon]MBU1946932.1 glycosyltransferase [Nanoarchaeota archaeon]
MGEADKSSWILYLGTFPPRECGIATFTKDLTTAADIRFSPLIKSKIVAMNKDSTNIYNYPEDVLFQINDSDIQEYIDTAKNINRINRIKLINIQHEFGIFGGEYGSYLIAFLEVIEKPVVITFHSVLPSPDDKLKRVVQALADKSKCIIVMAKIGEDILRNDYGIKTDIKVIPHGIPKVSFVNSKKEKAKLGYSGKIMLSSFGMVNSGKGYEYVIDALPRVVEKFPNLMYLIVGETHPVVRKNEGEQYRNFIEKKVKDLGLQKNVKFYNKYVTLKEIVQYLQATDIFICSNKNPNQVTSGTLAYAAGAGRAIISTPFLHAKELITQDRGILVEFNNTESFANAIIKILSDPKLKGSMEKNAYANTRNMTWNNVALAYNKIFNKYGALSDKYGANIPKIKLTHLARLTDDFGVIQFADNIEPNLSSGYTLDDNARAMIVCCMHYNSFKDRTKINLIRKYLNCIQHVQDDTGRFHNFVDYNRKVNMENWSEDPHGRAMWALGLLIGTEDIPGEIKKDAENSFKESLKIIDCIKSPRAVAYIIMGLFFYNKQSYSDDNIKKIRELTDHLVSLYKDCSSDEWKWFEEYLTYSNSKLPEAMFYSYLATKDEKYLDIAKESVNFLSSITFEGGVFAPIGHKGWYFKNGKKAYFDQQPVDTASMVQTLTIAYKVTGEKNYLNDAITAFHWFLGKNSLNQVVYDESTGGCHDG